MEETLKDLSAQKKESAKEKSTNDCAHFTYLAATREIALNVKVSLNHFMIKDYSKLLNNLL